MFSRLALFLLFISLSACRDSGVSNREQAVSPSISQENQEEKPVENAGPDYFEAKLEEVPAMLLQPPESIPQEIFKIADKKEQTSGNWNTEDYAAIAENDFQAVLDHPLSTFSVDVDRASYATVRRFLRSGQWPAPGSVRIEEMINYFDYRYQEPQTDAPFSVHTEMADCPWNTRHQLLRIGLKGKNIPSAQIPASNLVFLLDVSGSMDFPNKLPLLKRAFRLLTQQLRSEDRVAIVVYAGASGMVLPTTPGDQKMTILEALEKLQAGGSTAGADGIQLAYKVARKNFIQGGNNRVILATDGDFNVGVSSDAALVDLIEKERADGIFLSVLGFGDGNYKDNKMEQLADHGNGNYAYIDNILEAQKVLVKEFSSTIFTIAKDVKLQVEFNPVHVQGYRLIGYENRLLQHEDFNDDTKDAGEIGAGHTVTALYELIPAGSGNTTAGIDELEFQEQKIKASAKDNLNWISLKLRYKEPDADTSQLLRYYAKKEGLSFDQASENTRFAASVAGFGMLLRHSKHSGELTLDEVLKMAKNAKGADAEGYRAEFIQLIEIARNIK